MAVVAAPVDAVVGTAVDAADDKLVADALVDGDVLNWLELDSTYIHRKATNDIVPVDTVAAPVVDAVAVAPGFGLALVTVLPLESVVTAIPSNKVVVIAFPSLEITVGSPNTSVCSPTPFESVRKT